MRRLAMLCAVFAAMLFVLGGCVKVEKEVTVTSDAKQVPPGGCCKQNVEVSLGAEAMQVNLEGSYNDKREFALNPDGSGKVAFEYSGPATTIIRGQKPAPKEQARMEAAAILAGSKGVAAWKDVSYEMDKDGRLAFKGTAYFKDINKVNVHGGCEVSIRPTWQTAAGAPRLELLFGEQVATGRKEAANPAEKVVSQGPVTAKVQVNQILPKAAAMLPKFCSEWSFTLPGTPDKVVNFRKAADRPNTVSVVYDGSKMMEAFKAVANDDSQPKPGNDTRAQDALNEKLFGTRGPVAVEAAGELKPLFDYKAEVVAAKADFKALKMKLKPDNAANTTTMEINIPVNINVPIGGAAATTAQ